MIFKGIAPNIRYSDPKYFQFELCRHWTYIVARWTEANTRFVESVSKMGISMKNAAEQMNRAFKSLNKNSN